MTTDPTAVSASGTHASLQPGRGPLTRGRPETATHGETIAPDTVSADPSHSAALRNMWTTPTTPCTDWLVVLKLDSSHRARLRGCSTVAICCTALPHRKSGKIKTSTARSGSRAMGGAGRKKAPIGRSAARRDFGSAGDGFAIKTFSRPRRVSWEDEEDAASRLLACRT